MKAVLLIGLLLLIGVANADTLNLLQRPPPASARWTCAGTGFNAGVPTGICELKVHTSMRYAQPARYQYRVTWAADGTVTLGRLFCYSKAHLGSDHSGCLAMVNYSDTHVVVLIDAVPMWFVSANSAGAELVNTQSDALLWAP